MIDPPRSDEGLDVWFARRLEARGIARRRRSFPASRVAAVAALAVAVAVLLVVLWGAQGSSSSSPATSTPTTTSPPPSSSGSTGSAKKKTRPPVPWNQIHLTVLNGTATTGLAATTQSQLQSAGWTVTGVGDATTPTFTNSMVVYPPGKKALATTVANKLHLSPPVAVANATGVPSTITTVTVVVGSDGLPTVS